MLVHENAPILKRKKIWNDKTDQEQAVGCVLSPIMAMKYYEECGIRKEIHLTNDD